MTETGFIKVVLDDPRYPGTKCRGLVHLTDQITVIPVYAVEKDGRLWAATFNHPGAKAVSLLVTTNFGTFSTADWPSMVGLIGKNTVETIFGVEFEKEKLFGFASAISDKEMPAER